MTLRELRTWRNGLYLLLIVVAIVLVVINWQALVTIWRTQAWTFAGAVAIMTCGTFVQARNFLAFLDVPNRLRVWRFARVWALSALANYVAPLQPGVAVRVAWLSRHDVGVAASLLATWRQLVVSVWVALLGLAIGLAMTGDPRGRWPALVLALTWVGAFGLRLWSFKLLDRLRWPLWIVNRRDLLRRAVTGIAAGGVVGVVVQYVLGTILMYWVYTQFGASIGLGQALILTCLVYVSTIISILPGGLGVIEAIYILGGHGLGLSVAQSGALALLLRVSQLASNGLLAAWEAATPTCTANEAPGRDESHG